MVKLHIGCGRDVKSGYHNIDLYCGPIKMPMDCLDYKDNYADEILSNHTLEHIEHSKTEDVLREWYRVLKPGGKIRITVPDMERVYDKWINDDSLDSYWYRAIWGWQRWDGDYHYTGFTRQKISRLFKKVEFGKIVIGNHKRKTPSIFVEAEK